MKRRYYDDILNKLRQKIRDEKKGNNEYNLCQTEASRRFVYTDDRCISFMQFLFRDNIFDCSIVLRSSDASEIFDYDLKQDNQYQHVHEYS